MKWRKAVRWSKEDSEDPCAAIVCNITSMPDGKIIRWVQCDNCDEWFHNHCVSLGAIKMITLINLSLYVIGAFNNLLVLYKKERQENFIYSKNFCVLNLNFPPWHHQPVSHLTYCSNFKNILDNSKKYLQDFSNFAIETFGAN